MCLPPFILDHSSRGALLSTRFCVFLWHQSKAEQSSERMDICRAELWDYEQEIGSFTSDSCDDGDGVSDDDGVILGVDGGATSTICVCIAVPSHGHGTFQEPPSILSRAETSGSNHNSVGGLPLPGNTKYDA